MDAYNPQKMVAIPFESGVYTEGAGGRDPLRPFWGGQSPPPGFSVLYINAD